MTAVQRACDRDDFRPRPSALCDFCSFREFCPSYGGDPNDAEAVMRERAVAFIDRPPLALSLTTPAAEPAPQPAGDPVPLALPLTVV